MITLLYKYLCKKKDNRIEKRKKYWIGIYLLKLQDLFA